MAETSAQGEAAVQSAAPGEGVTVAGRTSLAGLGPRFDYKRGDGTSYAAPIVTGAAALLRRAAPGAPIAEIRSALERGARQSSELRGKVAGGALDVACALVALSERREPDWGMVSITPAPDADAYRDFVASTRHCRGRQPARVAAYGLTVDTGDVFADERGSGEDPGRHSTMQAFVDSAQLDGDADGPSLTWQARLIAGAGAAWAGGRAVFPIRAGRLAPVAPPARPVYEAGLLTAGCTDPGYRITRIGVSFVNAVKPSGWVFPTDAEAPAKRIQLAVAFAKPWYQSLLGRSLQVRADVRCEFFPGLDEAG
jgi:hypothetical protein